ncbi:cof protein [Lucifera butyrica]|uniref:Cof protein n=1 Tax=Lucifera butyrica TaxID=1351585 RepID=A0A498R2S3_9FIRM|nr:Cof-type HAD-IIB family hydrolase [Lucifera butyrica]VBB05469.1 cof protein [Lucifera butyrica]
MSIRLIAVDLDDTLLNAAVGISPHTQDVIRQAVAKGIAVTVATGRMHCSALPYAQQLGLDVPLITYNGAMIRRSLSGETLLHVPIEQEIAREVLSLFRSRGWYIQTYTQDKLYVAEINAKARYYENLAGVKAIPVGDELYTMSELPTKMLAMAEPEEISRIQHVMQGLFGDRLSMATSKPNYLEMVAPGVNKGKSLAFLAAMLNIPREEVMAIGDSHNDLDMIQYAGWGVAMGNAADKVKAAARLVTRSNEEDGVAEAIERYALQDCR